MKTLKNRKTLNSNVHWKIAIRRLVLGRLSCTCPCISCTIIPLSAFAQCVENQVTCMRCQKARKSGFWGTSVFSVGILWTRRRLRPLNAVSQFPTTQWNVRCATSWSGDMIWESTCPQSIQDKPAHQKQLFLKRNRNLSTRSQRTVRRIWRFPIFRNYLMTRWSYFHSKISGTVRKRSGQRAITELSRRSKVREWSAFSVNKISIKPNSNILPTLTLPLLTKWKNCKDLFFDKNSIKMQGC